MTLEDTPDRTERYLCFRDYGNGLVEGGWCNFRKREGKVEVKRGEGDPERRKARSVARAKREILRKCMTAHLDHLVTCTYRRNETSLQQAMIDATRFVQAVRKGCPDWQYIMTWEIQEERARVTGHRVWHLHFAVRGFQNIPLLQNAWESVVGAGMGNCDVHIPGHKKGEKYRPSARWGRLRLGRYLGKYIAKNFEETELNKKRYWHSEGVSSPQVERVPVIGQGDMRSWAVDLFKGSGVRVVRVWEHEMGLYGYISSF
jgi:hypothetical protein